MCRLSWNLGASTSWDLQGLSRPVKGLLYLYLTCIDILTATVSFFLTENSVPKCKRRCWSWQLNYDFSLAVRKPVLKPTITTDWKLHVRLFCFNKKGTYIILTLWSLVVTICTFCCDLNKAYCTTLRVWAFCVMLYVFFWVIPRRLNFICRRFGTLCLFHLHRQVGVEWLCLGNVGVFIREKVWLENSLSQ